MTLYRLSQNMMRVAEVASISFYKARGLPYLTGKKQLENTGVEQYKSYLLQIEK